MESVQKIGPFSEVVYGGDENLKTIPKYDSAILKKLLDYILEISPDSEKICACLEIYLRARALMREQGLLS